MLNEERFSDFGRRYAAALLAEGRVRLRDRVPSVPGALVAQTLWWIEGALPHFSRGRLEVELLELNSLKGAGWRRYTTARSRGTAESLCWRGWADTRRQVARYHKNIDAAADSWSGYSIFASFLARYFVSPNFTIRDVGEYHLPAIDKPLLKGMPGDGAPMTFSKLRRIVVRAQVLLVEYAAQRASNDAEKLEKLLWNQSIAVLSLLETIDAWEACHATLRILLDADVSPWSEQAMFDYQFERIRGRTQRAFPESLQNEARSVARLRANYAEASATRRR